MFILDTGIHVDREGSHSIHGHSDILRTKTSGEDHRSS
jgi:hypothetical protein